MEVDAEELGILEGGSCVGQDSKAEMMGSGVLHTEDTTGLVVASPLCQEPHSQYLPSLDDSKYSPTSLQRSCF